jgi:hypothetical protein
MPRHTRCAALRHSRDYDELWMPCTEPPAPGDMFCQGHREAANEIALGLAAQEATEEDYLRAMSEAARGLAATRSSRSNSAEAASSLSRRRMSTVSP